MIYPTLEEAKTILATGDYKRIPIKLRIRNILPNF